MNAGKSTVLLQSSYNYQERGMRTLLFTPAIDNRYRCGLIVSRIGLQAEAIPFSEYDDLLTQVKQQAEDVGVQCVLVDEAQFLTKSQVSQLTEIVDSLNIPVLAYGLRSDYRGEPFIGSQYLLTWADELIELKTVCHCGRKAMMNLRVNEFGEVIREGSPIHIGGNESFISVCRRHFKAGELTEADHLSLDRTMDQVS